MDKSNFIPFSLPSIGKEETEEVSKVLASQWITSGPYGEAFERDFANYVGAKHAIAVNSCTAALHLALEAVKVRSDDFVITTPYTFTATAEVIHYLGAEPLFIDIDPETCLIDCKALMEFLQNECRRDGNKTLHIKSGRRISAIIPVHIAGQACDMDILLDLSRRYSLPIISDAAHCLPTIFRGKQIGSIGDITCFSFYASKNISTGEGGMITTDNDAFAERMRLMRLHGINRDIWKRQGRKASWRYEVVDCGFKYNMTDIAAAMGIAQLKKADTFYERRREIADCYTSRLSMVEGLSLPRVESYGRHSWHLYMIQITSPRITRDDFIEEMTERGIGTSVHFIPLHLHSYYRDKYQYEPEEFPQSYKVSQRIVSLPIYPGLSSESVNRVIENVSSILTRG